LGVGGRQNFDRLLDLGTNALNHYFQSESYQSAFNKKGSTLICTHTNKGRTKILNETKLTQKVLRLYFYYFLIILDVKISLSV